MAKPKKSNGASAETSESSKANPAENATEQESVRVGMRVLAQYVKDLSFENPNAPYSFQSAGKSSIDTGVGATAKKISETQFEVLLQITVKSTTDKKINFNVELTYGGVFEIVGVSKEHLHPFVLIECPRMLFPFARQVVFDSTRSGGYPPLLLDIIDFTELYRKNMENNFNQNSEARTIN